MADTDRLSDERLLLAIERLGGLEEIHHSTYAEFFDDAEALATAARELLSRRTSTGEAVAWQWSDHHGMWYTVDTNTDRMSFEQQKELAQQVAASNGGTVRPLYTVDDAMVERAWSEVVAERARQISAEGWTPEHDDAHRQGELLRAAVIYLWHGTTNGASYEGGTPNGWPWEPEWWKPKDRHSNLVRAGALCLAERDRCIRLGAATGPADHKLGIVLRELTAALAPTTVDDAMVERARAELAVWANEVLAAYDETIAPDGMPNAISGLRSAYAALTAALRSTKP